MQDGVSLHVCTYIYTWELTTAGRRRPEGKGYGHYYGGRDRPKVAISRANPIHACTDWLS